MEPETVEADYAEIESGEENDAVDAEAITVMTKETKYYFDGTIYEWYEYEYTTFIPQ